MQAITLDIFKDELKRLLDELYDTQLKNIEETAKICSESIKNGGVVHVFGSGHSIGFGLEMKGQVGSLVPIHQIEMSDFVLKGKVTLEDFKDPDNIFERRPNVADKLYNLYDIQPQDVFIIISNSGINGVVIDMAIMAKERGHKIIVVTSWQHTSAEASRHPSGKKLYELGDVVIDNCGPRGDALINLDSGAKICSVSSITGAYIAQTIETECVANLLKDGVEAPILWDETLEGTKEHNAALKEKYKGRI